MQKSAFLIAGPKSNSGKTMITLGLIKALVNKGLKVQPFKCGPDYIDPMHHESVAGAKSYNLDTFMSDDEHVKEVFSSKAADADVSIVEGVMGLFDGASRDKGSSAEISKLLQLPVVLVVDAASTAYSVAPLLYGFKHFDTEVNLAGVIFNKVGSASHYSFLKDAADDVGIKSLGYIPKSDGLAMPSRHLGLMMPQDEKSQSPIDKAASLVEEHLNLDAIVQSFKLDINDTVVNPSLTSTDKVFAIAQDEAFNFMYPANIDALNKLGKVVYFSPLHDRDIPKADLLWLPGGYPELFAKELSENTSMCQQISEFANKGGAVVAECGGMMYMGRCLVDDNDKSWPMCHLFNYTTSTQQMKLTLGYRRLETRGLSLLGHEFHYSTIDDVEKENDLSFHTYSARNRELNMMVFRKSKIWSSYIHLYLGEYEKMKCFIEDEMNLS